jgi:hypothetical protein
VVVVKKLPAVSRIIAIGLSLVLIAFIVIVNSVPFNISRNYSSTKPNTLMLTPKNRINNISGISQQTGNLIYFNSKMPFKFDEAKVKVKFKNTSLQQQILLGYRDQNEWHYNAQALDSPLLDKLSWSKIGNGPYLYQKTATYKTTDDFLKNPPQNKIVGTSAYKGEELLKSNTIIPNYQPSTTNTSINVPLRGKTTMYVYLNHEPFNMSFTKQDLNWHSDPDAVKISVYKSKDKVFDATIDDDGNDTDNQRPGFSQTVNIKNPGPGLPESGVYKILIDAPEDSIITNITTNLHKIAFEGPLYVADNHEVYGGIVKTNPTRLVTNAQSISFRSEHKQSQIANVDNQVVKITKPGQTFTAKNTNPAANITIPASDMIINGSGYFAFSADQFFIPIPYKILPINSAEDIAQADYVLTDYKTPKREGEWLVAEREFDLHDAAMQKGQLSWLINAPGLKENKRTVEYKQIDMTLTKKGWFKQ